MYFSLAPVGVWAAFSTDGIATRKNLQNKPWFPCYELHVTINSLHHLLRSGQKCPVSDPETRGMLFTFLSMFGVHSVPVLGTDVGKRVLVTL